MTTRYEDAYNAIAREQARVAERALTMVLNDEERHRRDTVLIALDVMRHRLSERGVTIAAQEVLTVFEEITGTPTRGLRLPRMLADAHTRQHVRSNVNPKQIMNEATRQIEEQAAPRTAPRSRNHSQFSDKG